MTTMAASLDADATTSGRAVAPALGRILLAAIFLLSGFSKITAPEATIGYIQSVSLPFPQLALAGAVGLEIIGGLMLVVGFGTRFAAAALALFALATGLIFHFDLGDQNQFIHFFKNVAITGGLLQVVAFGAGPISMDRSRI